MDFWPCLLVSDIQGWPLYVELMVGGYGVSVVPLRTGTGTGDQAVAGAMSTNVLRELLKLDTWDFPVPGKPQSPPIPPRPDIPSQPGRGRGPLLLTPAHMRNWATTTESNAQTWLGVEAAPTSPRDLPRT